MVTLDLDCRATEVIAIYKNYKSAWALTNNRSRSRWRERSVTDECSWCRKEWGSLSSIHSGGIRGSQGTCSRVTYRGRVSGAGRPVNVLSFQRGSTSGCLIRLFLMLIYLQVDMHHIVTPSGRQFNVLGRTPRPNEGFHRSVSVKWRHGRKGIDVILETQDFMLWANTRPL